MSAHPQSFNSLQISMCFFVKRTCAVHFSLSVNLETSLLHWQKHRPNLWMPTIQTPTHSAPLTPASHLLPLSISLPPLPLLYEPTALHLFSLRFNIQFIFSMQGTEQLCWSSLSLQGLWIILRLRQDHGDNNLVKRLSSSIENRVSYRILLLCEATYMSMSIIGVTLKIWATAPKIDHGNKEEPQKLKTNFLYKLFSHADIKCSYNCHIAICWGVCFLPQCFTVTYQHRLTLYHSLLVLMLGCHGDVM